MDADVLYPAELLRRLVASRHENCLLIDASSEETGEEMMVGFVRERANKIARRVGAGPELGGALGQAELPPQAPRWDLAGENVGFMKASAAGMRVMRRILEAEIAAGR